MPFQRSTMTSDDVPMPKAKRPGAASAMAATLMAMRPGPRVKAGMIATPSRAAGAHCDAKVRGVKPSVPPASLDHRSV